MDPDNKDFLLHLYDKLWENMYSKEARLWTYLAIYGAAIGLTFGAGKIVGLEVYALIFVLILTYWAILIVINVNWWYSRNQLLVTRVENAFEAAVIGIVPKSYRQNPNFRYDRLHELSILILLFIGTLFFLKSISTFWSPRSISNIEILVSILVAYLVFALGLFFCLHFHEFFIRRYYQSKLDLWEDAEQKKPEATRRNKDEIKREDIEPGERKSRGAFNWRWFGLVVFVLATACLDFVAAQNGAAWSKLLLVVVAMQIVAVWLSFWLTTSYPADDNSLSNSLRARVVYCLILLSCVILFFSVSGKNGQKSQPSIGNAADFIALYRTTYPGTLSLSGLQPRLGSVEKAFFDSVEARNFT